MDRQRTGITGYILGLLLLFGVVSSRAQSWDPARYEGARCHVVQVRDVRIEGDILTFTCDLANTGKMPLRFRPDTRQALPLVVFTSDASLEKAGLQDYQSSIAAALLRSGRALPVGAFLRSVVLQVDLRDASLPEAPEPTPVPNQPSGDIPQAEAACADLVIDTMLILREKKYRLDVVVRIRNQGTAAAQLYRPGSRDEAMGATFYLGNTPEITRSAFFIQGAFVRKILDASGGALAPGASVDWPVTLRMSRRPGYMDRLQCQLDNFRFVQECDQTNNAANTLLPPPGGAGKPR